MSYIRHFYDIKTIWTNWGELKTHTVHSHLIFPAHKRIVFGDYNNHNNNKEKGQADAVGRQSLSNTDRSDDPLVCS